MFCVIQGAFFTKGIGSTFASRGHGGNCDPTNVPEVTENAGCC